MKQYFIVRHDLNMRKGKIASQCAHASNAILLDDIKKHQFKWAIRCIYFYFFKKWIFNDDISKWLNGNFTKIVLQTKYKNSNPFIRDYTPEQTLDKMYETAKSLGVYCSIITDNGLTEFNDNKTKTVVCIGPINTKDKNKENVLTFLLNEFKLM